MSTQLILGSAQFGAGYGVTNGSLRLEDDVVEGILLEALRRDVRLFDTASEYGDAQTRLGAFLPQAAGASHVSKFSFGPAEPTAETMFAASMRQLSTESLYGLLFHRISDLLDVRFPAAVDVLRAARAEGVVQRLGVSVYDVVDLELAISRMPDIDLVQFPGSIVDLRLIRHPLIADLHSAGVEMHVRSAFLQGLLLQSKDTIKAPFEGLRPVLAALDERAEAVGVPRLPLLLSVLRSAATVDAVVVGATSVVEFKAIAEAWATGPQPIELEFPDLPLEIVDPRRWR